MARPKKETEQESTSEIELVKMYKGDLEADVHPLEVDNYKLGDWTLEK